MVAFQLALATNVNQSVLIISHLETVCTIIYIINLSFIFINLCLC